ncbi:MAG: benzoyl-CoA reductase, bzd-type, subunit N [Carboxydocellales bacterium]
MFSQIKEWVDNRHEYAKQWQARTGGKVLGYFCTYAPEEVMYAAGVLPVRILGSHEPLDVTEPYIFGMYCPFCRDCLAQGLKGRFDYLNGIMIAHSCLHIRQAYTSWEMHVPVEYSYYLPMPNNVQSPRASEYLTQELGSFKKTIEELTGNEVSDAKLDEAIATYNTTRRLMKQIYEMRKQEDPLVTGLESMYMVLAAQMVDKAELNKELEKIVAQLPNRKLGRKNNVRLIMVGSEDDDRGFVEMIESLNANVVTDEHCTGSRYFWNEVEPEENRLAAIAKRYVNRTPCPSKDWPERRRVAEVVRLAKEWNCQGALMIQQKFCDPHESDIPSLKSALEAEGIKTYFLELDVTVPLGQFKIRVEAFLEMLEGDLLF